MDKLVIISNESIFTNNGKFYCDNLDMKSTPEGLNNKFEVYMIARKSQKIRAHEIKVANTKTFKSIFTFLGYILIFLRNNNTKYLIISITPYTFFAILLLRMFKRNPIVYLRSDGFKEYDVIAGFFGKYLYKIMFDIVSKFSNLISCSKNILRGKKGLIVKPSQLNEKWFANIKPPNLNNIKLLYIGRLKKEKGIFDLLKMIENHNEISLTIVGSEKNSSHKIFQNQVNIYEIEINQNNLIKYYDEHNIFILPSFTEGHPMVLIESLSRMRPVIIFEDIKHVMGNFKGVFICERNNKKLLETINHIKQNYKKIQKEMENNELPSKKGFINNLSNIILNSN